MSSDPFGFDMSVSADKKRRTKGKRGMSGAVDGSARICESPGCEEKAAYRAPASPDNVHQFTVEADDGDEFFGYYILYRKSQRTRWYVVV